MKIDETIMQKRRLERLQHLQFFMTNEHAKNIQCLQLGACHNLLTGFFQNSKWATAWYCFKYAVRDSWENRKVGVQIFWHRRIMRRSIAEMEFRMFGIEPNDGPDAVDNP